MKRIIMVLLLVSGTLLWAFELDRSDDPVTITGYASLTWGYDLDTGANGFVNAISLAMEFPLLTQQTPKAGGEGLYGSIEIDDLEWGVTQDSGSTMASYLGGNITAAVNYDPVTLAVYGKPAWAFNKNVNISADNDGDILFSGFSDYAHGTTISYMDPAVPVEAELLISSMGVSDWRENTEGNYCFGTNITAFLFDYLFEVQASLAFNPNPDPVFYGGIEIPLEFYLLEGLLLTPAADFRYIDEFAFDAGLTGELQLSPKNNDDLCTEIEAQIFYGRDEDLSTAISFAEPTIEGLVEHLGFGAEFALVDLIENTDIVWEMKVNGEYELIPAERQTIIPSVVYSLNSDELTSLKASLEYEINSVANTEFTIGYYSGNLLADQIRLGYIEAVATLSL